MKLQASPVKEAALALGLPLAQPSSLRDDASQTLIAGQDADVMVVAAYGLILPPAVLALPRYGCLNIHASLLPRWRGAAPIQRAIAEGDNQTGISIMQMDVGLDTGAVLSRHPCPILATDTAQTLHDRLASLGAKAIVADLQQFHILTAQPQPIQGVTYAEKLSKNDAKIDWTLPASVLERRIRAFNPVPGAWTTHQGQVLKIWQASPSSGNGTPGTVLHADKHRLQIACGEGALDLLQLQPSGSKSMPVAAFLAGNRPAVGHLLETSETPA